MVLFNHYSSIAFLAAAATVLILAGNAEATAVDLCKETDFKPLCRSVIKATADPVKATELAINALIAETKHVREATKKIEKSQELDVCNEEIDDAIDNLHGALDFLKKNDKGSLNSYLSAVLTDFVTCNDAYEESGLTSPIAKIAVTANNMASNCLALASQIH